MIYWEVKMELQEIHEKELEELIKEITSEINDKKFEILCLEEAKKSLKKLVIDYKNGLVKVSLDIDFFKDNTLKDCILSGIREYIANYTGKDMFINYD